MAKARDQTKDTLVIYITPKLKHAFKAQCMLDGVGMSEKLNQYIYRYSMDMLKYLASKQVKDKSE